MAGLAPEALIWPIRTWLRTTVKLRWRVASTGPDSLRTPSPCSWRSSPSLSRATRRLRWTQPIVQGVLGEDGAREVRQDLGQAACGV